MRSELYVLFDDDVARLKLEFWRRRVFVHYHAKGSSYRVARRVMRAWPDVRRICRALGFGAIEALFPTSAAMERLCKMLGFGETTRENGLTYMRCRNA